MDKTLHTLLYAVPLTLALLAVSACDQEGPAERAGAAIDQKAQQMKDAVDPPGPMEKAGRAIDNAAPRQ